jgi:hypothetical protein
MSRWLGRCFFLALCFLGVAIPDFINSLACGRRLKVGVDDLEFTDPLESSERRERALKKMQQPVQGVITRMKKVLKEFKSNMAHMEPEINKICQVECTHETDPLCIDSCIRYNKLIVKMKEYMLKLCKSECEDDDECVRACVHNTPALQEKARLCKKNCGDDYQCVHDCEYGRDEL